MVTGIYDSQGHCGPHSERYREATYQSCSGHYHAENCVTLNDGEQKFKLGYEAHFTLWSNAEMMILTLV